MTKCWIALLVAVCAVVSQADTALWVETSGTMILPSRAEGPTKELVLTGVRNEM